MEDYIEVEGLLKEILDELLNLCSLTEEEMKECIEFLYNNKEILSEDELIQHSNQSIRIDGVSQFITDRSKYYINIKKSTIYLLLWFMGKITSKNLFTVASASGWFNGGSVIEKINEQEGEKCILMEMMKNRKKGADINILSKYHGECCNNHYDCHYNKNGFCVCTTERVAEICKKFEEKGILIKKGKKYIYQM